MTLTTLKQAKDPRYYFLIGILLLVLTVRLILAFTTDINWDEFYFLSNVYDHINDRPLKPLQTFHVHWFTWLSDISDNEVTQIIAARVVMYTFSLATLYLIYKICLHYTSKTAAIFGALAYSAFSPVVEHAASFRTDPIATSLLMAALYIVIAKQWRYIWFFLSGILIGLAGLITIKSILMTPLIGGVMMIGVYNSRERKKAFFACSIAFLTALTSFYLFYLIHKYQLPQQNIAESISNASHGASKTILSGTLFPQLNTLSRVVYSNFVFMVALFFGLFITIHGLVRAQGSQLKWATVLFLSYPLITLAFYRNSFPYFYPMIMAPVTVLLAITAEGIIASYDKKSISTPLLGCLLLLFTFQFSSNVLTNFERTSQTQIATIEAVHKMFPEPVGYIDRNSMVSSFPKKGFFMSSWGLENYHSTGAPVMQDLLQKEQPKFLIANIATLEIDNIEQFDQLPPLRKLLKEDLDTLRANYIHHWGKIYVAGRKFSPKDTTSETEFDLLISGDYTMESRHPVMINDTLLMPGHTLFLNQGSHILKATVPNTEITLRFGKNLYKPPHSAPEAPIYFGF